MASNKQATYAQTIDEETKNAFLMWMDIMNEMTGGAFVNGYRPPTKMERIAEWDMLTPEQINTLRERKGEDWVVKQAVEIDRIRNELDKIREGTM